MNHIKLLVVLAVLVTTSVFGQERGYFGKNTFLEIGVSGQLPIFNALFNEDKGYVFKNNELQKSYNLPDFNFRASLGSILTENVGLALEFNQRMYNVNLVQKQEINRQFTDAQGNFVEQYKAIRMEYLPISESMILPRVIFSTNESRIPAGFSHELGIGYSIIQFRKRDLEFASPTGDSSNFSSIQSQLLDTRVEDLRGLTYMYGFRINIPLSKSILFNIGFRYQYATLLKKKEYRKMEQTEDWVSGRELWSRINSRRQLGIINIGAGFTFCF